ncbi:CYTH domain-containing protein [Spirosoma endbachense]|uniref:CYTH domain-containing protein n=1 Tax=Spirosoma endbachense TaxID=2666025 RepID=A0A6P1W2E0_9BACT|nr:CYTH domain-containing protein [Spirosoma endbachense]QHV98150.1 CYTH domain-containing protein [Spirosoma endbachense]
MGIEIERKFLVKGTDWKQVGKGQFYQQGYLSNHPDRTVRVRRVDDQGYITIKGKTSGASRSEYEYPIPIEDALEMLHELCEKPIIVKVRYRIPYEGLVWEVDEFQGENQGMVVAEVELSSADQTISLPDWVGQEVTSEAKYYNANLSKHPFPNWSSHRE